MFNAPTPVTSSTAKEDTKPLVTTSKPDLVANIPVGWSGKLPKFVFLEHCRKKKIPKPKFTKIPRLKRFSPTLRAIDWTIG